MVAPATLDVAHVVALANYTPMPVVEKTAFLDIPAQGMSRKALERHRVRLILSGMGSKAYPSQKLKKDSKKAILWDVDILEILKAYSL